MFDTGQIGDSTTGPHGINVERECKIWDGQRTFTVNIELTGGYPNPKSCQL